MRRSLRYVISALVLIPPLSVTVHAQTTFYFPQIADGGVFSTTIFIANPGSDSTPANVTITLTRSFPEPNGSTWGDITFVDQTGAQRTGPTIGLQIAGGRSVRLVSNAASPDIQIGFATVSSDLPVTGSAVYSLFTGTPGASALIGEGGVGASAAFPRQAIFVDETPPLETAFAYANPSSTVTANLNFNLLTTDGVTVQTTARMLSPMNHGALFVNEMFSGVTNHVGTLQIESAAAPVTVVALRFAEGRSRFTSLPPFSLAAMISPVENWLNHRALPSPLASLASIVTAIRIAFG